MAFGTTFVCRSESLERLTQRSYINSRRSSFAGIVDECTGPMLAQWLRKEGHDVFSVFEQARGIPDEEVLLLAAKEQRILITNDKDFGEMAYRNKVPHCGIVLLRLADERSQMKIQVVSQLLEAYADLLTNAFVVVNEDQVRFAREN